MTTMAWNEYQSVCEAKCLDGFTSSVELAGDLTLARAYLKARAADAVACYRTGHFESTQQLAVHLARYW